MNGQTISKLFYKRTILQKELQKSDHEIIKLHGTVKPVLSGHSKIDKTKVLLNGKW